LKGGKTMRLNAYLVFDGHCQVAFKFYEQILGGKIEAMVSSVGTPMEQQVPPERHNKILNARLILGDAVLIGHGCSSWALPTAKGFLGVIPGGPRRRSRTHLSCFGGRRARGDALAQAAGKSATVMPIRMWEGHLLFPVENK
jgi:hypothetical protein